MSGTLDLTFIGSSYPTPTYVDVGRVQQNLGYSDRNMEMKKIKLPPIQGLLWGDSPPNPIIIYI